MYTINIGTVKMDPTKMKRVWSPKKKKKKKERKKEERENYS